MTTADEHQILNIVPITFSDDSVWIGTTPFIDVAGYRALREVHWRNHAFRFDNQQNLIENIPVIKDIKPLGTSRKALISDRLGLVARAVQHAALVWIAGRISIQTSGKQLTFWGQAERTQLLTQVLKRYGITPVDGLEVVIRYMLDCRSFVDTNGKKYLGLTIGISTSNRIEISTKDLIDRGLDLVGREVCRRRNFEHDYLQPGLETLGRVVSIEDNLIYLADAKDVETVEADSVMLQPTVWNLNDILMLYFGNKARQVINQLSEQRARLTSADGKLAEI